MTDRPWGVAVGRQTTACAAYFTNASSWRARSLAQQATASPESFVW